MDLPFTAKKEEPQTAIIVQKPDVELEKAKLNADIARILEAAKPPNTDKNYLDLETAKAVMELTTADRTLLSTTNIGSAKEEWDIIKLLMAYHYTGNAIYVKVADWHLKMNRSRTERFTNLLEGFLQLPRMIEEEAKGRWGRFKQFVGGR